MGTPTLPNIDLIKSAFDTANNDLVVAAKANRVTTPDTAAAARPIAQWGNLVDDLLRKMQLRAARSGRSVLEHGAVGDGTTSDATAFQDAIDAVDADGGGKVLVPPPPTSYVIGTPTLRSGVRLHYTDSGSPNGKAYGTDGDRYTRTDGAVTEYVKTGGTGTSGWTDMASATAPDLETVLASGNTVDDAQSIDYVDDFDVVRASSDYDVASGLQRLRTFTSGAALSATLAIATATGVLTYDGPIELSNEIRAPAGSDLPINPGSSGGDQVVIDGLRWPEADGTANQVLATNGAANLFWKDDNDVAAGTVANSSLRWSGTAWVENANIIAQPDGRLAVAGGATASAHADADDFVVATSTGQTGLTIFSGGTSVGRLAFGDGASSLAGQLQYVHNGDSFRIWTAGVERIFSDASGFRPVSAVDGTISLGIAGARWSDFHAMQATIYGAVTLSGTGSDLTVEGTGTSTFAGAVHLASPNAALTIGNTNGQPTLNLDKQDAGVFAVNFRAPSGVGSGRWQIAYDTAESLDIKRLNNVGTTIDHPIFISASTGDVNMDNRLGVSGATIGDANGNADDLVVGDLTATSRGVTIAATGTGYLNFADVINGLGAHIRYKHAATEGFTHRVAGADRLILEAFSLRPSLDDSVTLGQNTNRWSNFHAMAATIYGVTELRGNLTFDADNSYNIGATTIRPTQTFTNGLAVNAQRPAGNYSISASDGYVQSDSDTAELTLPDASDTGKGAVYLIEIVTAHTTGSLKNSAGDTINGNDKSSTGQALNPGLHTVISDGISDWRLHGPLTTIDTTA